MEQFFFFLFLLDLPVDRQIEWRLFRLPPPNTERGGEREGKSALSLFWKIAFDLTPWSALCSCKERFLRKDVKRERWIAYFASQDLFCPSSRWYFKEHPVLVTVAKLFALIKNIFMTHKSFLFSKKVFFFSKQHSNMRYIRICKKK